MSCRRASIVASIEFEMRARLAAQSRAEHVIERRTDGADGIGARRRAVETWDEAAW
jgi:hypothetical protein